MKVFCCTGHVDAIGDDHGDRRFMVLPAGEALPSRVRGQPHYRAVIDSLKALITVEAAASSARTNAVRPTPPIGTPTPPTRGGNSTPARAPVAGVQKSPVLGPVSGE